MLVCDGTIKSYNTIVINLLRYYILQSSLINNLAYFIINNNK